MALRIEDAYSRVGRLRRNLEVVTERDPEQEVQGMALPVIDAVLNAAKEHLRDDPVIARMRDVISPEASRRRPHFEPSMPSMWSSSSMKPSDRHRLPRHRFVGPIGAEPQLLSSHQEFWSS